MGHLHHALPDYVERQLCPVPWCGCWLFTGNRLSRNGYGRISWGGKERVIHRIVYEMIVGVIPEGILLDHKCRVRCCANPDHLEPVTVRENTRRGEAILFGMVSA